MFWNLIVNEYERLHLHHILLFVLLIIYSIVGALAFCALEGGAEEFDIQQKHVTAVKARKQMLSAFHHIYETGQDTSLPPEGRVVEVVNEYNRQMGLIHSREPKWTIWGGLYYAGTIYTTIGYGDLAAVTLYGRLFTVLYAVLGIPLVITILNDWGSLLFNLAQFGWNRLIVPCCRKCASRKRKRSKLVEDDDTSEVMLQQDDASSEGKEEGEIEPLPIYAVVCIFLTWILLCSAIFSFAEGWPLYESLYFFFISLTTIGFGDITPRHHIAVFNFIFILLGLSVVSMTINVIQMQLELLFVQIVATIENDFKERMLQNEERRKSLEGTIGIQIDNGAYIPDEKPEVHDEDFIKDVEKGMHGTNKLLMKFMSGHQKKMLNEKFEERNKMRNRATQTTVQIKAIILVASVQTKDRDSFVMDDLEEEDEHEEVVTTQTMMDGRVVTTTRLVPKRKMYIYNTGD